MMGLLTKVLLAPVALPVRGLGFVFHEIHNAADRELNDPAAVRQALLDLQQRLDAGLIDLPSYDAAETELLGRLAAIAERGR
jgi:Gas vesicle protein G